MAQVGRPAHHHETREDGAHREFRFTKDIPIRTAGGVAKVLSSTLVATARGAPGKVQWTATRAMTTDQLHAPEFAYCPVTFRDGEDTRDVDLAPVDLNLTPAEARVTDFRGPLPALPGGRFRGTLTLGRREYERELRIFARNLAGAGVATLRLRRATPLSRFVTPALERLVFDSAAQVLSPSALQRLAADIFRDDRVVRTGNAPALLRTWSELSASFLRRSGFPRPAWREGARWLTTIYGFGERLAPMPLDDDVQLLDGSRAARFAVEGGLRTTFLPTVKARVEVVDVDADVSLAFEPVGLGVRVTVVDAARDRVREFVLRRNGRRAAYSGGGRNYVIHPGSATVTDVAIAATYPTTTVFPGESGAVAPVFSGNGVPFVLYQSFALVDPLPEGFALNVATGVVQGSSLVRGAFTVRVEITSTLSVPDNDGGYLPEITIVHEATGTVDVDDTDSDTLTDSDSARSPTDDDTDPDTDSMTGTSDASAAGDPYLHTFLA